MKKLIISLFILVIAVVCIGVLLNNLNIIKVWQNNTETYALESFGGWGGKGDIIITLDGSRANVKFKKNDGNSIARELQKSELEDFLSFIKGNNVDNLKPLDNVLVLDGIEYNYIHTVNDKEIKKVYMNNPQTAAKGSVYDQLVNKFWHLVEKMK